MNALNDLELIELVEITTFAVYHDDSVDPLEAFDGFLNILDEALENYGTDIRVVLKSSFVEIPDGYDQNGFIGFSDGRYIVYLNGKREVFKGDIKHGTKKEKSIPRG